MLVRLLEGLLIGGLKVKSEVVLILNVLHITLKKENIVVVLKLVGRTVDVPFK